MAQLNWYDIEFHSISARLYRQIITRLNREIGMNNYLVEWKYANPDQPCIDEDIRLSAKFSVQDRVLALTIKLSYATS